LVYASVLGADFLQSKGSNPFIITYIFFYFIYSYYKVVDNTFLDGIFS
jgi:hypothetical protein